jgi:hypothetical protein
MPAFYQWAVDAQRPHGLEESLDRGKQPLANPLLPCTDSKLRDNLRSKDANAKAATPKFIGSCTVVFGRRTWSTELI